MLLADRREHVTRHCEDRADEHVFDGETHPLREEHVVVPGLLHLFDEPDVAVVLAVARALRRVGDDGVVLTNVRRHHPGHDSFVCRVPSWGVVHARLPAVEEGDAAVVADVTRLGKPAMPPDEVLPSAVEKLLGDGSRRAAVSA